MIFFGGSINYFSNVVKTLCLILPGKMDNELYYWILLVNCTALDTVLIQIKVLPDVLFFCAFPGLVWINLFMA